MRRASDRPAVRLYDDFGIRVSRLNPDQVAELVLASVHFGCMIWDRPDFALEDFLAEAPDPDSVASRWSASIMPFVLLLVDANTKRRGNGA